MVVFHARSVITLTDAVPNGSNDMVVLGVGVFLLKYFPLVEILCIIMYYNCLKVNVVGYSK